MKKVIVLNQKNSLIYEDVLEYIKRIKNNIRTDLDVVVCPSNIYLPYFNGKYDFKLGSQNICFEKVTGEVLGSQLKSIGVSYVIVGHFERKKYLNETSDIVNKKIKEALKNNIIPIVCIGETKEERSLRKTQEIIKKQLKDYFYKVDFGNDIIIAYEPIWAISSGNIPENKDIQEVVELIKNIIFKNYNINVRVIYGGSVDEKTIKQLNMVKELDGYLLGNASTSYEKTLKILDLVE